MSNVDDNQGIDEDTLRKIWLTLPSQICPRHRTLKRNGQPTDWNIEDLRNEFYGSYGDPQYFRRHMAELANRHPEIQVEEDVVRLTPQGIAYCKANIPGMLDDFD